jgi:hypothetical protein
MARLALYVTPFEMREIKKQAGDVPISKWCKKRVLESMTMPSSTAIPKDTNVPHDTKANPIPDMPSNAAVHADVGRDAMPAVPAPKPAKSATRTCVHGTAQGYRCWQCGGKAKVNE